VLVGVLLALPPLIRALPASDADVPAAELRDAVLASAGTAFTGFAESAGGLTLPVGSRRFAGVVDLFSDRTRMRVWWRAADDARVDVLTAGGETGYHLDRSGSWTWDFERDRAVRSGRAAIALPAPPDLLPSSLGRRLLSEAADDELSRTAPRRVAGRDGLGLRVTPSADASSVGRVDLWVDAETGLPLQLQLYGRGADTPALDTRFLDLDVGDPGTELTRFTPPPGAFVSVDRSDGVLDRADDRLARVPLPDQLAGLPRREVAGAPRAVGLYGRGVTLLAVVPVPDGIAFDLAQSMRDVPGAIEQGRGVRAAVGPLGLMVLNPPDGRAFVVTGTVTLDALGAAAAGLRLDRGQR
jgi:outer membrane lipoprotein-sorting protein